MTDVCPKLGKRHLECEQHHDDSDESKGKENVTGLAFHLSLFLPNGEIRPAQGLVTLPLLGQVSVCLSRRAWQHTVSEGD